MDHVTPTLPHPQIGHKLTPPRSYVTYENTDPT
jgi:hypothetical protein